MTTPNEVWKPIPDFDGYEASSLGRIRSYRRRGTTKRGKTPIILNPTHFTKTTADGKTIYTHRVATCLMRDRKRHMVSISRLVLAAFVGPRPEGHEACHYDGDAANNALSNLRWDTHAANCADTVRYNRKGLGVCRNIEFLRRVRVAQTKILSRHLLVRALAEMETTDKTQRAVATEFGMHESNLHLYRVGKRAVPAEIAI